MDIKKFLNEHGITPTSLREEIINILSNIEKPISCDELVEQTSANKTTIYRNLTLFEEKNILISSETNRKHFYELAKEAKAYFVCDKCHKMEEITMPNLDKKHVKSVVIKGICDECYK
ncbi:transcriptional regulator, Fur family [Campylobacter blaseri]|uniref:Ferric uptake regulation protein n=1 Tax=Campylobacter blaseri TaxID=2042961 RepID=A0A2P8R3D7_9BACT|nr:transcriptional repressor [Campylobacter blaseri]PSM53004.1 Fur family transcriptional regulator [Campylobacter blaseri]PSM54471.1 Fur family transcriptional regulator [Campylobacter blaseri]QKF85285.1 transcriptional regulator, Fur family [Campylobacter blaseri]